MISKEDRTVGCENLIKMLIANTVRMMRKRDFGCALTAVAPLEPPRIGSDIRLR